MWNFYRQLVNDTRQALQENFLQNKILLTSHSFAPPVHLPEQPPLQPPEQEPLPPPPTPPVPQQQHMNIKPVELKKMTTPLSAVPPIKDCVTFPNNHIKERFKLTAPHIRILDTVPSDAEAQKLALAWQEKQFIDEITLLSFAETEKEEMFMQNLAIAITQCLKPAKVIDGKRMEKENKWHILLDDVKLRWVLAPPLLTSYSNLMHHYKELPATSQSLLGSKPLFFLNPISSYLKSPTLKVSLWQKLSMLL